MIKQVFPCYAHHAQRAKTWAEHPTLSCPPRDWWQHQIIFLMFLPFSCGFPKAVSSFLRQDGGGSGDAEHVGMPGPGSCIFTGRTKASGAASTAVRFKDSHNLARHSLNFLVTTQIKGSRPYSFCWATSLLISPLYTLYKHLIPLPPMGSSYPNTDCSLPLFSS